MNDAARRYLLLDLKRRERESHRSRNLLLAMGTALGIVAIVMAVGLGAVLALYQSTTKAHPPLEEQLVFSNAGLTRIFDRDGVSIGVLNNPNSAIASVVTIDAVSPHIIEATVSTEDNAFWEHQGFDLKGLARATWHTYVTKEGTTGGSTITQQLVKNAFFNTDCEEIDGVLQCWAPRTVERKIDEIMLSIEAEGEYSKEQILQWYLNSISYSGRYVGIEAASRGYYRKSAAEVTLPEAALLAGIPAAPTVYNPRTNCVTDEATGACLVDELGRTTLAGAAKARQEYVLNLMAKNDRITPEEAAAAIAEPVFIYSDVTENRAAAFVDEQVQPRLVRMCQAGLLPLIEGAQDCVQSVHSAGYKVTTTLSWTLNLQALAFVNQYVNAGLEAGCDCHNGAVVSIEPTTGQVVVYVPNRDQTWVSDPRVSGSIDQATEIHQPGSSFKPAVYLAWFDTQEKTPMSVLWDTNPMELIDEPEDPEDQVTIINPGRASTSQGLISARAALGGSQNVAAFRAAEEAGIDNVIRIAKALGITTLEQRFDPTFRSHPDVIYGSSIATGGANVRVFDMAYMNATIANMGMMVGVPTYAGTLEVENALSVSGAEGEDLERALEQRQAFIHGHIRLPDTRELDPVVVLRVESADGTVIYEHGEDLQRIQTVDAGSVWMLHSIMSDCTARFIIWVCGSSNTDTLLDVFANGQRVPGGVKTGTQQAPTSHLDTLETWVTGYSRYLATAVWIGNADKSPVQDGPAAGYSSARAALFLYKNWMGYYHEVLYALDAFETPAGFEDLQPANVKLDTFQSSATERGVGGGCFNRGQAWQRTDVDYQGGDCLGSYCIELPEFKKDLAIQLARRFRIAACGIQLPAVETQPAEASLTPPSDATPQPATPAPGNGGAPDNGGPGNGNGNGNGNGSGDAPGNSGGNGNNGPGNSNGDERDDG